MVVTKKAKAMAIYNKYAPRGRRACVERFVKDLDMNITGASTYYSNIKSGKWK
ncbi:MAG: hypothetical protein KAH32_01040 [Chlamydiia bacterium]|nr:hypothetical protein [Chlamydiia bacterium]